MISLTRHPPLANASRSAIRLLAIAATALTLSLGAPAWAEKVQIDIRGLSKPDSTVYLYVFTASDGFPRESAAAQIKALPGPHGTSISTTLDLPASPDYALMAYEDLNGNGKMDRWLGMIPQEPYALSRNPTVFAKPRYADSAVKLGDFPLTLTMH